MSHGGGYNMRDERRVAPSITRPKKKKNQVRLPSATVLSNHSTQPSKKYRRYKHLVFELDGKTFTLSLDGGKKHNEQK